MELYEFALRHYPEKLLKGTLENICELAGAPLGRNIPELIRSLYENLGIHGAKADAKLKKHERPRYMYSC